jgi:nucleotide-binding universal stress UspA family protein
MGIGRHDLAARLLGGEVALRTIRRARTPVLAVTDAALRVPARVAVAAVDFSASSVKAARAALELLDDGGTLYLAHVWSRTVIEHPTLLAQDDAYERALPERLARVAQLVRAPGRDVAIVPTSLVGHAAEEVVRLADARGADVVAAGSRGHGVLDRLLVGSVTSGIVRGATCAVLVTPEPTAAERAELQLALAETTESHRREEWASLLDAFTRRNRGRRTAVEVDDPDLGAQAQETGYAFLGATYDRHDGRVELMLGDAAGGTRHLTRLLEGATSIGVRSDAAGRDVALAVSQGEAQTLLTFLGDAP